MARTKDEIFKDLLTRKDDNVILGALLTSNSKASFYQMLFTLYSEVVGDFELTFDAFEARIDTLLESKQVHSVSWWRRISLGFQLGDALITLDNGNLAYATENTDLQIIKRAAVITSTVNGAIDLKVAKVDVTTLPVPLSTSELSAFTAYINDVGPAGVVPTITSTTGDELQLEFTVVVDPAIIDTSNGQILSDASIKPVEDAINNYLSTFQNDDFGGVFYANKFLQAVLSANGVIHSTLDKLEKKSVIDPEFIDVLAIATQQFSTFSGYVRLAEGFDLSANITYTS